MSVSKSWTGINNSSTRLRPATGCFQPRRLSVIEYRNTLRSVFGFDWKKRSSRQSKQFQRSLVIKLLPTYFREQWIQERHPHQSADDGTGD